MADGTKFGFSSTRNGSSEVDFTRLKQIETGDRVTRTLRLCLMLVAAVSFWLVYGLVAMVWWFMCFALATALHVKVVRNLPERGTSRQVILPMITFALMSLVYLFAGIYLWVLGGDPIFEIFSLLFLVNAALNAIALRAPLRLLFVADLIIIAIGLLVRVGWLIWNDPGAVDAWVLSGALLFSYVYFMKVALGIAEMHRSLDSATRRSLISARRQALSQFTGGVAHDFNNLMTAVLGNMELARLAEGPQERDELICEAEKAARRGADLTSRLLALSSKARLSPVSVRPEQVAETLRTAAAEILPAHHRFEVSCANNLPAVHVDVSKLQTVLQELIRNASDAMPSVGSVRLGLHPVVVAGSPGVCFEVSDTGPGIPSEMQSMVFEPYFTTRPVGHGSGLGLAMVRGFVEQSGGEIRLISGPGDGACFRLDLPGVPVVSSLKQDSGTAGAGQRGPGKTAATGSNAARSGAL